jgi:hypothetical protein
MRIQNWALIAVAVYFNVLVAWAGGPTFNPPPIPGSASIYKDLQMPGSEPYSNTVTVPNPIPMPPPVSQPNPALANCPNRSPFDGQCYDSNWNKIIPQEQTPPPSAPCNPCQPVKLNSDLSTDIVTLTPPQAFPPPSPSATPAPLPTNPYRYQTGVTGFYQPQPPASIPPVPNNSGPSAYQQIVAIANGGYPGVGVTYRPGGISLSKAAAERMALNINVEVVGYHDGKIVLAGSHDSASSIDAGLFLTSLRLACSSYDPSFSLDAVNGAAWVAQGEEASKVVWQRIADTFSGAPQATFQIQTVSVNRQYPALWAEISSQFPELRTRLVFRPDWLRQTRFGEILYKADVLLKELTTGVSIVEPEIPLRANAVPDYISAEQRRTVRDFLSARQLSESGGFRTSRMWFDLMPDAMADQPLSLQEADNKLDRQKLPGLYALLRGRGLVGGPDLKPVERTAVNWSGEITELSDVYPTMFVRYHNFSTGQDTAGVDPDLERIARDVDRRTSVYAQAYPELRKLTEIFRAYVANVSMLKQRPEICRAVPAQLSDGEKTAEALPEFRPSELTLTVAKYALPNTGGNGWQPMHGSSVSGGISLRGKQFYSQAARQMDTPPISEMRHMLAVDIPAQRWKSTSSGREYLAFAVDGDPPPKVPIVTETRAH